MKYNQPYGISDPEGPYINGNPSTGTMGSIPPAASIEYPQREIVNLITHAGLVNPDNTDLHQLSKSVQSMLMNAQDDAGTANAYQVTMHPAPNAYYKYLMVIFEVGNSNTGPSVMNVNALGPKPIVRIDGTALDADALIEDAIVCLMYDGVNFQMVWSSTGSKGIPGLPNFLTAPKDIYVNNATGNDVTYDGTTAAFVTGTIHGPFKTIQRAANEVTKYNLNGFNITVHVADGTYATPSGQTTIQYMPTGSGFVIYLGNRATPANVVVQSVNRTALQISGAGQAQVFGFKFTSSGSNAGDPCAGVFLDRVRLTMGDVEFGFCSGYMVGVTRGASMVMGDHWYINGSSPGNPYASGGFIACFFSATVESSPAIYPLYMHTNVAISVGYFVSSSQFGALNLTWTSYAGFANVSGQKYIATANGVISSGGGGASYYPGNMAGTVASGGQYV
ncbi:hypothetical protein KIP88_02680 [Bradyrhizobium sp. SRL28]|uniref:hypothetical protein n=1 Tax=Bradyrhizobium sp. SRL28 TaxID=2836178 RepID=UPI001BDDF0A7|nr:hypothetical protein [Bradyrhizobium sp. SRL28]MBT1509396.1 hypothetical protein [Bradyrhizobium sp. SRL28]